MFDLALAHILSAERERDLATDLRDRRILKAAQATTAAPAAARRSAAPRTPARTRAYGR